MQIMFTFEKTHVILGKTFLVLVINFFLDTSFAYEKLKIEVGTVTSN